LDKLSEISGGLAEARDTLKPLASAVGIAKGGVENPVTLTTALGVCRRGNRLHSSVTESQAHKDDARHFSALEARQLAASRLASGGARAAPSSTLLCNWYSAWPSFASEPRHGVANEIDVWFTHTTSRSFLKLVPTRTISPAWMPCVACAGVDTGSNDSAVVKRQDQTEQRDSPPAEYKWFRARQATCAHATKASTRTAGCTVAT